MRVFRASGVGLRVAGVGIGVPTRRSKFEEEVALIGLWEGNAGRVFVSRAKGIQRTSITMSLPNLRELDVQCPLKHYPNTVRKCRNQMSPTHSTVGAKPMTERWLFHSAARKTHTQEGHSVRNRAPESGSGAEMAQGITGVMVEEHNQRKPQQDSAAAEQTETRARTPARPVEYQEERDARKRTAESAGSAADQAQGSPL